MFKLMIVDDEPVVRHGIQRAIPWEEHGVRVVGQAENYEEALALAGRHLPDIVLCDIRMPGPDGFTLIRELKSAFPAMRFVVLSGYSDQEYMFSAIRHHVSDYLLKPAGMAQIRDVVLRLCREIHDQRRQEQRIQNQHSILRDNLDLLLTSFLERLLASGLGGEQLAQMRQTLGLPLAGPRFQLLLARGGSADDWVLPQDMAFLFKGYAPVIGRLRDGCTIAVILNCESPPTPGQLEALGGSYPAFSQGMEGPVAVSPPCGSLEELSRHYPALLDVAERRPWFPKGSFVQCTSPFPELPLQQVRELEGRVIESVKAGELAGAAGQFEGLMELMRRYKPPLRVFQDELKYLYRSLSMLLGDQPGRADGPPATAEEARELFYRLHGGFRQPRVKYGNSLAGRALEYIEQHYRDDLTLEKVAGALFISPTHLSHVIKQKTDRGFQSWLHDYRIRRAKELLDQTDLPTGRVAELVGYHSYKVFSEHFRRQCGMTASQYRHAGERPPGQGSGGGQA